MTRITFDEVKNFRKDFHDAMKHLLDTIEDAIVDARDESGVPIYLTKVRIKSATSIYLKTKRKNKYNDLHKLTDCAGVRILCMFEQDIVKVHEYLITDLFQKRSLKLIEFRIFNWDNETKTKKLQEITNSKFSQYTSDIDNKDSGYKSIHYVVSTTIGDKEYNIEIQLRTLLQDVWGELEHRMSYKQGHIHPHIKNSFYLLSKDLSKNDLLLTHLKNVSDKEHSVEDFSLKTSGPLNVLRYEKNIVPKLFTSNNEFSELYSKYNNLICSYENGDKEIDHAKEIYTKIRDKMSGSDRDSQDGEYWINMEKGFLLFAEKKHDEALILYNDTIKLNKKYNAYYYVPCFRKGEILLARGETENALVAFDICEENMERFGQCDEYNRHILMAKLAYNYWAMGEEYTDISIEKIATAEDILAKNPDLFSAKDKMALKNNACWYYLEKFIQVMGKNNQDDKSLEKAYDNALHKFKDLAKYLEDSQSTAHVFDTAAWFCYQSYLKTNDPNDLDMAREYCEKGWERHRNTTNVVQSTNLFRRHFQQIMTST